MTHRNMKTKGITGNLKSVVNNKARIILRKEELDLLKQRVKTGEVKIHKEILKEERNIAVPVTREELVIETREIGKENAEHGGGNRIIRIPVREERIKVVKHPVKLEDVSIYKHQIEDLQHIEETLKSEKLHVKKTGDVNLAEKQGEKQRKKR